MSVFIAVDVQQRARELAGTIREAVVHLVDSESDALRGLVPQALASVQSCVPDDAAVQAAGDALRALLAAGRCGMPARQEALATLDRYDQALSQALQPAASVKLVIWDLDDTFWRGTLAEGDALEIVAENVARVRELTRRGIVNAICSKNDFAAARSRLQQAGVWDHFVFPHIAFAPKGELIRDIIEQAQLRAENVLFVDDNELNLQEARYYNPGLQTLAAGRLHTLFDLPGLAGKPDGGKRLAQYKLLEQRASERRSASSNEDFLRQSDIRVRIMPTRADDAERVHDMLTRTNQLNFTKQRLSLDEVCALIADPSRQSAAVSVRDRFGDHGVVGWYCLHEGRLEHFLFSCRIINLGIEQFVYRHLGRPHLDVVGETASSPFDSDLPLDYITLESGAQPVAAPAQPRQNFRKLRIFASGACDMYYVVGTLANALTEVTFECNTFRGATRGVNVATEYLRSCFEMSEEDKALCARHFHNYTGQTAFDTHIFDGSYDFALLSFNDDAELVIYEGRDNPRLRVVLSESAEYSKTPVMPPAGTDADAWLCEHFHSRGLITPDRFRDNLLWIADRMPATTRVLLMTLPEFDYFRCALPTFPQYRRQCLRLNRVIRDLCATDARFGLVEMNRHVTDRSHFTDYVMHLRPERGFLIGCEAWHQMAQRPVDTGLHKQLPLQGRKVVLLGKGLETVPMKLALSAAGVKVDAVACEDAGLEAVHQQLPAVAGLSAMAGQSRAWFAIVTPRLGADDDRLQSLGFGHTADRWVMPESAFNLDWKER